jgi:hypothetical protein
MFAGHTPSVKIPVALDNAAAYINNSEGVQIRWPGGAGVSQMTAMSDSSALSLGVSRNAQPWLKQPHSPTRWVDPRLSLPGQVEVIVWLVSESPIGGLQIVGGIEWTLASTCVEECVACAHQEKS